jgi:hypothetical protein
MVSVTDEVIKQPTQHSICRHTRTFNTIDSNQATQALCCQARFSILFIWSKNWQAQGVAAEASRRVESHCWYSSSFRVATQLIATRYLTFGLVMDHPHRLQNRGCVYADNSSRARCKASWHPSLWHSLDKKRVKYHYMVIPHRLLFVCFRWHGNHIRHHKAAISDSAMHYPVPIISSKFAEKECRWQHCCFVTLRSQYLWQDMLSF